MSVQSFNPESLNTSQRAAVEHDGTHLLIVAGPGTGKTRTLVCRIARLAKTLSAGRQILAVTFTNKAADEMRERLTALDAALSEKVEVGTFHAFALQLLRRYRKRLSFPLGFTVITPDEAEALAAELMPAASRRERRDCLLRLSAWKATLQPNSNDPALEALRSALRARGLVDFDDILRDAVLLLRDNSDLAREVRQRYPFVMVDEYQDVNAIQVELLRLLAGEAQDAPGVRLTVIGDPNQAIYGFRGSEAGSFRDFDRTFAPCRAISLNENYRSAGNLLAAGGQVIKAGSSFPVPELVARIQDEGRLAVHEAAGEKAEARFVADEIARLVGGFGHHDQGAHAAGDGHGYAFGDIAVLFRLKTQSHALEEALAKAGLPFRTCGVRPPSLSLASRQALKTARDLSSLTAELERLAAADPVLAENMERVTTLLASSASVTEFLDRLSLETPEDVFNSRAGKVSLLTLHAAKGLEFPVVFIVGCESGLLPLKAD
ncbi:MAG: ATP-dependent helicase, partial [Candidatus Omnitrophica bacterium]|nr:ATP-dependent helicase [Candidatus Omnitrophota bacterium]